MRRVTGLVLGLGVVLGGCASPGATVRGAAPSGEARSVAQVKAAAPGGPVTVAGEMVEKCPVAGCWFMLKDESGTIKVSTKAAGFVVVDVPLHHRITASGTVKAEGEERIVDARGIRY